MMPRDWVVLGLIVLVAAGLRVSAIDSPPRRVFDELWYARDGCYRWLGSQTTCELATFKSPDRDVQRNLREYGEVTPEHPPLGKLLIGAPIKVFGFGPRAWRLAALLAGVLTVALLFAFVRLAVGSTGVAAASGLLLAVDYPHFIHSRLATLDIFLCLFVFAAFLFCYLDRAQLSARLAGRPSHHRWRLAAGVAAGAAAATKPSGGAVAVGVLALVIGWEMTERRRSGQAGSGLRAAASIASLLVVVPLVVYASTYIGLVHGSLLALPWSEGSWIRAWADRQSLMMSLHVDKPSTLTSPWVLPMTERPIAYLIERRGNTVSQILLFGNPLLWWGGFCAVLFAAVQWMRDRRSTLAAIIVVGFLAAYASWLAATLTKTVAFLFYIIPVAPLLYLALAYVYTQLPSSRALRLGAVGVVVGSLIAFAFYLPILTALPLDIDDWRPRACSARSLWLDPQPDCGLRQARPAGPRQQ